MTRPPPLTPPESDLRDFQFMPLDVVRLAQSDLVAFEDPAAVVAALLLWGASWHGKPAGSLTNDDRALAKAAGYGRGISEWLAVKEGALRGFVECSDGRLYHPVVAEKVRDAWGGKLRQRHRTFCAAIRKHNERNPTDQRTAPSYEAWETLGRPKEVAGLSSRPEPQPRLALDSPEISDEELDTYDDTRAKEDVSRVTTDNVTRDRGGMSRVTEGHVTHFSGSKGEGEGEGQGEGDSSKNIDDTREKAATGDDDGKPGDLTTAANRFARAGGVRLNPAFPAGYARELDLVKAWFADGIAEELIVATISGKLERTTETSIGSFKFYDGDIRKAHALATRKRGGAVGNSTAKPLPILPASDDRDDRVERMRDELRKAAGSSYAAWLGPAHVAVKLNGVGVIVTARSPFNASYIESNFGDVVRNAARAAFGDLDVVIRSA